jgi:hypothetical protein
MGINEMVAAIAQDAYENATEDELRHLFTDTVSVNLAGLSDDEIREIYNEIVGDA